MAAPIRVLMITSDWPDLASWGGTATFIAVVRDDTVAYRLTFSGLSSNAVVSHIHFGQRATNGTPFVWLCGAVPAGLPAAPACPAATSGTVTGTLTAANVAGVPAQGIPAGDFQALVRILRSGSAYANIHTTTFGGGEIRGQIHFGITDDD